MYYIISMSKSGSANEALQIYRGGRTLLQESRALKTRLESVLLDLFNTKSRQEALRFSPVNVGRLKELHGITIFDNDLLNDVRTFVEKAGPDVINRYKEKLCKEITSCRKASYHRARFMVLEIEKSKLTIYHLLHSYNNTLQAIVAGRRCEVGDMSKGEPTGSATDWLYLLGCIDEFNQLMKEDPALLNSFGINGTDGGHDYIFSRASNSQNTVPSASGEEEAAGTATKIFTLQCVRYRWTLIHGNHHPSYIQKLGRQTSSSQILRCLAIERCYLASFELAKTIVLGYDRKTIENVADEAAWLTLPQSITPSFTSLSGLLPGLSKITCISKKNKDGNGNKRKNRNSGTGGHPSTEASPGGTTGDKPNEAGADASVPAEHVLQRSLGPGSLGSHVELVDSFVGNEEAFLSDFFAVLAKVKNCHFIGRVFHQ